MKSRINKRKFLVILLVLLVVVWLVPTVFAAPLADGFVPTPTITPTLLPPTAPPPPTDTPTTVPYPAAATEAVQAPTQTPEIGNDPGNSNAPEQTNDTAAAAGSSVLGFLLCAGVIIVAGLAALNIWARRRP